MRFRARPLPYLGKLIVHAGLSLLSLVYEVDRTWQPVTCSIREGLDFFADQGRNLSLRSRRM